MRAMQRWPNVPALFGWLGLDRRGRWLIKGEMISHPLIVQTINRNYGVDEHGRYYFQNGPQRGYVQLASCPFVLRTNDVGSALVTHNELAITQINAAYLDEEGTLVLGTEHGAGEIAGADLEWMLERIYSGEQAADENALTAALSLPSGTQTTLRLEVIDTRVPVVRLDHAAMPTTLGFVRDPQPREDERVGTQAPD